MKNWKHKVASVLLLVATAWYLPWALRHLNRSALWLSLPFAAASALTVLLSLVTVVNHWQRRVPAERPMRGGTEPIKKVLVRARRRENDGIQRKRGAGRRHEKGKREGGRPQITQPSADQPHCQPPHTRSSSPYLASHARKCQ